MDRSGRAVLLCALALATACQRQEPRPGVDRPLRLLLSPGHAPQQPGGLAAALERAGGLRLELRVAASSGEGIDLVQSGQADAALLPLFDFLFCAEVYKAEPLLQVLRRGGQDSYRSELVVQAASPARELKDLAGQRVGFVEPYSVTGFLLPAALLRAAQVEVAPAWLGSHDAVIEAVAAGKVAAGASFEGHGAARPGLRVLASTEAVANEPVFVQASLPATARERLRAGLLAVAREQPALLAGVADVSGFRPAQPDGWRAARAAVEQAGKRVEDLVPGGWTRANEHRRPLWTYAP